MFTKKSSLILSAVIATFLISTSFPTMAVVQEAGLPEKSSTNAGSRWEQMIKKQQEEAAAEAAAKKQAALETELKSMGKEVPTAKESEVVKEQAKKPAEVAVPKEEATVLPKEEVKKPYFKPGATWGERHLGKTSTPAHKPPLGYEARRQLRIEELRKQKAESDELMAKAKKTQEFEPSKSSTEPAQSPKIKKMMQEQAKEEPVKIPEPPKMDQNAQEATQRKGPPPQSPAMKRIMEKRAREAQEKELVMKPAEVTTLHSTTTHPPVNLTVEHPKLTTNAEENETVTVAPPNKIPTAPTPPGQGGLSKKRAAPISSEEPAAKKARVDAQQTESPTSDKAASTDTSQKPDASGVFAELLKKRKRVD